MSSARKLCLIPEREQLHSVGIKEYLLEIVYMRDEKKRKTV